ncbi:hypothetical protein ACFE04_022961 [Oxalis oulophora]
MGFKFEGILFNGVLIKIEALLKEEGNIWRERDYLQKCFCGVVLEREANTDDDEQQEENHRLYKHSDGAACGGGGTRTAVVVLVLIKDLDLVMEVDDDGCFKAHKTTPFNQTLKQPIVSNWFHKSVHHHQHNFPVIITPSTTIYTNKKLSPATITDHIIAAVIPSSVTATLTAVASPAQTRLPFSRPSLVTHHKSTLQAAVTSPVASPAQTRRRYYPIINHHYKQLSLPFSRPSFTTETRFPHFNSMVP